MSDADSEAQASIDYPDVREHLAELLASGEPSLDEVDWGRFRHAYGSAVEVPDLLRTLSARDQQRATAGLSTFRSGSAQPRRPAAPRGGGWAPQPFWP